MALLDLPNPREQFRPCLFVECDTKQWCANLDEKGWAFFRVKKAMFGTSTYEPCDADEFWLVFRTSAGFWSCPTAAKRLVANMRWAMEEMLEHVGGA